MEIQERHISKVSFGLLIDSKKEKAIPKSQPDKTMTPHEYMSKHLRKLPEGGIAWHRRIFTSTSALDPVRLIDAAVDIAWTILMPNTLELPSLEIKKEGKRIVFRLETYSLEEALAPAM